MRKLSWFGCLSIAGLVSGMVWVAPAAAKTVYSWRTEDGVYAFTDDRDAIPARYRADAVKRSSAHLRNYDRYTPQAKGIGAAYAAELTTRLEHLREFNREVPETRNRPAMARFGGVSETIRLSTGDENAPAIDISSNGDGPPIVVETLFTRPEGGAVTRQSLVVSRGGKTVAVVLPRSVETNVNDIIDESDFR